MLVFIKTENRAQSHNESLHTALETDNEQSTETRGIKRPRSEEPQDQNSPKRRLQMLKEQYNLTDADLDASFRQFMAETGNIDPSALPTDVLAPLNEPRQASAAAPVSPPTPTSSAAGERQAATANGLRAVKEETRAAEAQQPSASRPANTFGSFMVKQEATEPAAAGDAADAVPPAKPTPFLSPYASATEEPGPSDTEADTVPSGPYTPLLTHPKFVALVATFTEEQKELYQDLLRSPELQEPVPAGAGDEDSAAIPPQPYSISTVANPLPHNIDAATLRALFAEFSREHPHLFGGQAEHANEADESMYQEESDDDDLIIVEDLNRTIRVKREDDEEEEEEEEQNIDLDFLNGKIRASKCPKCGVKAESKSSRRAHYKKFHYEILFLTAAKMDDLERWVSRRVGGPAVKEARMCQRCDKPFKGRMALLKHIKEEHNKEFRELGVRYRIYVDEKTKKDEKEKRKTVIEDKDVYKMLM